MMDDLVRRVRQNIANAGGSEAMAISTNESLRLLWADKQSLLEEMNRAKKAAAEEAARPYLDLITEVDQQYAFLLQMVGDNGEKS